MRLLFRSTAALTGVFLAAGSWFWLNGIQVSREKAGAFYRGGYISESPALDESRKRCRFESQVSDTVLAVGDVITIVVSARNEGYYQGDRIDRVPNPYYGAPPAPKRRGVRGGDKGVAYNHTLEYIDQRTEIIEPIALDCTATLNSPGFTPVQGSLTRKIPFGESNVLGRWSLEATSAGYKKVTVGTHDPNVFHRYAVEVRKSHLGIPLWAEEWAARAGIVLGPMLTLPWWLELWRSRRDRKAKAEKSAGKRPVLDRLRGRR